jgi:murein DD-endopeptidase MepM/ murein hydrolase activator NlpD
MESFESLLSRYEDVKVIDASIGYEDYVTLDLSVSNRLSDVNTGNAADFEQYIENYLAAHDSRVAFGGYNEKRDIYKRSTIFNDDKTEERNIHIGLDLWIEAGTEVLAALDGKVHSFYFNSGWGDYGPTIILEHTAEQQVFYTLYGHLSLKSIAELEVGTLFKKGQPIGTLGDATVNGDYAPHLHFQIIRNIANYFGDYPGVCSKKDLDFYLKNCPDPNLLLKIS